MVKNYNNLKITCLILFVFTGIHSLNAQVGRLPTAQELATKATLQQLYHANGFSKSAPTHLLTTGAEQNCDNAIPVCQQNYSQSNSYTGPGTVQELSSTCLGTNETNSVWYIFTVQNSGTFTFLLNTANDYDFALYNISATGCAGVPSATPVRCNFSATYGSTGLTLPASATANIGVSASGSPTMPGLNVTAGQTFALIIDNFSANTNGYTLTFGGTAQIFDNVPPTLTTLAIPCNSSSFNLNFSEPVNCNSIATNGTDFTITGPSGPITVTSATGNGCSSGAATTNFATVNFNTAGMVSGTYTVNVVTGSDGNTMLDKCGNVMLTNQVATFSYLGPLSISATNSIVCAGSPSTLSVSAAGNPSGLTYAWAPVSNSTSSLTVSPNITTTYLATVNYGGCSKTISQVITVGLPPVVYVNPANATLCSGTTNITATSVLNGSPCLNCNYVWSGSAVQTNNNVASSTVSGAGAGSYSVTVTSSNGCPGNTAVSNVSIISPASLPSCNIVYASPAGGGTGLIPTSPTDIITALTLAACNSVVIKMQIGDYNINNPLNVSSYVTMEGGFNVGFTLKTSSKATAGGFPTQGTRIIRSTANLEGSPGTLRYTGINIGPASTNFRLQDIRVDMPDNAAGTGISNYGVYLGSGCSTYDITRCYVYTGNAGSGAVGTSAVGANLLGINGRAGGVGGNGNNTAANGGTFGDGGAEATGGGSTHSNMYWNFGGGASNGVTTILAENGTAGVRSGGEGGAGGSGGYYTNGGGIGSRGGNGGGGAAGGVASSYIGSFADCGHFSSMDGDAGGNGSAGANGAVGATGPAGSDASGYYVLGTAGGVGGDGGGGGGGTGGDGGGGDGSGFFCFNTTGTGGGGAGGGGGGQGGIGGNGGSGGGSTFGIFIFNNGTVGNIKDCQIVLGAAGAGGAGGAGTIGANGGLAGIGGCADACTASGEGNGGNSGAGGKGGNGGIGGSGATGLAIAVRLVGGAALASNISSFTLTTQPVLTVDNIACTNISIAHTSTVVAPSWSSFGTSATPASALGSPVTTTYSTTGRKTLTLNASNYTDFNNILIAPPSSGNIIASATSICPGSANYASSAIGTTGFNYAWSVAPATATISAAASSSTSILFSNTGAVPITYTVTLTIKSNCCGVLTPLTQTIIVNPIPAAPTASANTICIGGIATYSATAPVGNSFSWYNAASSGTLLASGTSYTVANVVAPTTVYLQTTNSGGCSSALTPVVVTPTAVPAPVVIPGSACNIGLVQVGINSVPSASGYSWFSDAGGTTLVQSGTSLSYGQNIGTLGGSYTVYVQSTIPGCNPSPLVAVSGSVSNTPIVLASTITPNDTVCIGTPVTLSLNPSGGNGSYTYTWSPFVSNSNTTTQTFTNSTSNSVFIESNGCIKQFVLPIIVSPYPKDSIVPPSAISCISPSLTLNGSFSASGANITYSWTTSGGGNITSSTTANTVTINAGGNYTLIVTNTLTGCSSTQSVTVSGNTALPTLTVSPTNFTLTCVTTTVQLTATTTSSDINYAWTTTGGVLNNMNTANPVASASGTYSVTITNTITGCQSFGNMTVVPDASIPVASISSATAALTCFTSLQSATVTVVPSANITYSWNPNPASGAGSATPTFSAAGTYSCLITNTTNSCTTSSQIVISTNTATPVFNIDPTQTITCTALVATINSTVTSPSSGIGYVWTGAGTTGSTIGASVNVNAAGNYTLTVMNTANGCTATATSSITLNNAIPTVSVTPATTTISCITTSISLNATTNSTIAPTWVTPSGAAANPVTATVAGNYVVTTTDATSGCTNTQTIIITGDVAPPTANTGNVSVMPCGASTVTLNGSATPTSGVNYSWTGPSVTSITSGSNTANPIVNQTGVYTLSVTNTANGCSATSTINITQGSVTAGFTANPTTGIAPLLVNFTNQSTGATTYNWSFGDGSANSTTVNPSNTFTTSGTYTVTLLVSSGTCTALATGIIIVESGLTLEIPNVFTPNGDGINDVFTITSSGVKEISLQIFNRWGLKLYEFSGAKAGWDGIITPTGAKATDGTYFFFVKATGFDDKTIEKQGTVNLFR